MSGIGMLDDTENSPLLKNVHGNILIIIIYNIYFFSKFFSFDVFIDDILQPIDKTEEFSARYKGRKKNKLLKNINVPSKHDLTPNCKKLFHEAMKL